MTPLVWTRQPQFITRPNLASPFGSALVGLVNGAVDVELIGFGAFTEAGSGATARKAGYGGVAYSITTAGTSRWVASGTWSRIPQPLTFMCYYRLPVAPTVSRVAGNFLSGAYGFGIHPNSSNFRGIANDGGGNSILTGIATNTLPQIDFLVVNGFSVRYYQIGQAVVSGTLGSGYNAATGSFTFGDDNSLIGAGNVCDIFAAALWNVALPEAYIRSLQNYSSIWQLFAPLPRRIFAAPAAVGGGGFQPAWAYGSTSIVGAGVM